MCVRMHSKANKDVELERGSNRTSDIKSKVDVKSEAKDGMLCSVPVILYQQCIFSIE